MHIWFRRSMILGNSLLHTLHLWAFRLVCERICPFRCCILKKGFSHTSQIYRFSPKCSSLCAKRLSFLVKYLLHTSHLNGLRPVCLRMCIMRLLLFVKFFWQISHLKGPPCTWVTICASRSCIRENTLLQNPHLYIKIPLKVCLVSSLCCLPGKISVILIWFILPIPLVPSAGASRHNLFLVSQLLPSSSLTICSMLWQKDTISSGSQSCLK